jgi:hypothetical protein
MQLWPAKNRGKRKKTHGTPSSGRRPERAQPKVERSDALEKMPDETIRPNGARETANLTPQLLNSQNPKTAAPSFAMLSNAPGNNPSHSIPTMHTMIAARNVHEIGTGTDTVSVG